MRFSAKKTLLDKLKILSISTLPLIPSCSIITPLIENEKDAELRSQGYVPAHTRSCGAESLKEFINYFGIIKEQKEISKEILDNSTWYNDAIRNFLGFFHNDFIRIVWHSEIEYSIKQHLPEKYKLKHIEGTHEELETKLKEIIKDVKPAIALTRKKGTLNYHWNYALSSSDDPFTFNEKIDDVTTINTPAIIKYIYLAERIKK